VSNNEHTGFGDDTEPDPKDEGMHVFYVDPSQEAEKERFMQLIENGGKPPSVSSAAPKKKGAPQRALRRSARKSGT